MAHINVNQLPDLNGMLPLSTFTVMVKELKQNPSKRTNAAMDELTLVILQPNDINGVAAAGREAKMYLAYSLKNIKNCKDALDRLGVTGIDWNNIDLPDEDEVKSEQRTRCADIQDITLNTLPGKKFEVRLKTEPLYKTDTGTWSGRKLKNEAGEDIITGHRMAMADTSDIMSPLRDMNASDPFLDVQG